MGFGTATVQSLRCAYMVVVVGVNVTVKYVWTVWTWGLSQYHVVEMDVAAVTVSQTVKARVVVDVNTLLVSQEGCLARAGVGDTPGMEDQWVVSVMQTIVLVALV